MFRRALFETLRSRLGEPRRFMQVLAGPRQVGKTTLARQVLDALAGSSHYASADAPTLQDSHWLAQQWEIGRLRARDGAAVLVLDEIQKIPRWSEVVKRLWDADTAAGTPLGVVLLGSAPLLMQQGLTESLAGRFELLHLPHWSFAEMREAFGFSLDQYIKFGGYPGAAPLVDDPERWARYIRDALIETTLSRDVLLMNRVQKPALLRRLFQLGCEYSGQILSYQKMLGQLHDAGNTTTLAHYLELLGGAGMLTGLTKYAPDGLRRRAASPKLQVLNTALLTAMHPHAAERSEGEAWGHLVESVVGAHLVNSTVGSEVEVSYWRDRGREVDFVLRGGGRVAAIEVKSGRRRRALAGMAAFAARYAPSRTLLVGGDGFALEEFLLTPATAWLAA